MTFVVLRLGRVVKIRKSENRFELDGYCRPGCELRVGGGVYASWAMALLAQAVVVDWGCMQISLVPRPGVAGGLGLVSWQEQVD